MNPFIWLTRVRSMRSWGNKVLAKVFGCVKVSFLSVLLFPSFSLLLSVFWPTFGSINPLYRSTGSILRCSKAEEKGECGGIGLRPVTKPDRPSLELFLSFFEREKAAQAPTFQNAFSPPVHSLRYSNHTLTRWFKWWGGEMVLLLARKEAWSLKGKAKCFSFQLSSLGNPCFQPPQSPSGQMILE